VRGDQPSRHITKHLFCRSSLGDVLNCTVQLHDTSLGITLHFTPGKDPSLRAIRADHLKIELVTYPSVQRLLYGAPQPVPTFDGVELWVVLIAGSGQLGISTADSIKFF